MTHQADWQIAIHHAGVVACGADWSWDHAVAQQGAYHLWQVYGGQVTVETGGERYELVPGDMFLFRLHETHRCYHDPANPLGVQVICFALLEKGRSLCLNAGQLPLCRRGENHTFLGRLVTNCIDAFREGDTAAAQAWMRCVLLEYGAAPAPAEEAIPDAQYVVDHIRAEMLEHPERPYPLEELCRQYGYSRNHLIRLFLRYAGTTPTQYLIRARLEQAKRFLLFSDRPIGDIALSAGYGDASHFTRQFKQYAGMSPRDFRNWNAR